MSEINSQAAESFVNECKAALLSKEQILAAAANRKTRDVEVERFGGSVRLRELSTGEMLRFRKETADKTDEEAGLELLARCWVDEAGARMFEGTGAMEALGSIPVEVLNALTPAVLAVNGLGAKAEEEAGNG
jgi:hypothetical protein